MVSLLVVVCAGGAVCVMVVGAGAVDDHNNRGGRSEGKVRIERRAVCLISEDSSR